MATSDCDWLFQVLRDGEEHTLTEILMKSYDERGHGLTVHSRVAELRDRGHEILWHRESGKARGSSSVYRLVT